MKQYVDGLIQIIKEGRKVEDRTGTGTISLFGELQSVYDMKDGFPSLGLKNNWWKGIYHELLWFLDAVPEEYKEFGNTNIKYLVDNGVGIWNEWPYEAFLKIETGIQKALEADPVVDTQPYTPTTLEEFVNRIKTDKQFALKWGNLGPVYGKQWVDWHGSVQDKHDDLLYRHTSYNQIKIAIQKLNDNPDDRGNIVSAWNVGDLDSMALRPCHTIFQLKSEPLTKKERFDLFTTKASRLALDYRFYSIEEVTDEALDSPAFRIPKRRVSLKMYQRSCDTFLGSPFNIASYSALLHMIASITNQVPHKFIHTIGDAHIYSNHYDQVNELLSRTYGKENPISDFVGNPSESYKWIGNNMGPALPKIWVNPEIKNIQDFRFDDVKLEGYTHYGSIKAPVAV